MIGTDLITHEWKINQLLTHFKFDMPPLSLELDKQALMICFQITI